MEKIVLILLAAGNSRRFQGNKLLFDFHQKPMYRHIIDEINKLPPSLFFDKIVVTQYPEIADALRLEGYQIVMNPDSNRGISSSIQLAINAVDDDAALCFAVCDQPYLKAESISELIEHYQLSGKGIGCLSHLGRLGNPAIFASKYRADLLDLQGDVGGRVIIRKNIPDLYLYEVTDGMELMDIDKADEALS